MIEHHLITLQITADIHLHAYVMTNDRRTIEHTINRMFDLAESGGARPLPIILDTTLGGKGGPEAVELVHRFMREKMPEAWETQQQAKDFHLTVWSMGTDDPWDQKLMKLH